MASVFYSKELSDYEDIDNITGDRPGYEVTILENDAGVGILFQQIGAKEPVGVFFSVEEANEMLKGLKDSINRAKSKRK